ncbi:MAG TPA: AAA family ATPase [Gammaproteobacteria bacterium]|jgi:general secretion pathway protein A|nr:AAA family ATPase [Gammaproteobacteria bacterium]
MYASYFGLSDNPFAITPDPRFLFLSARHTEALAHLLYGVTESGGFIQLTGEVGTGKTTLVRTLLEKLPDNVDAALVINPRVSVLEFLRSICRELGMDWKQSQTPQDLIDTLNAHLLKSHEKGRRVVLIIDEAQGLTAEVLEQVRLLTNLETREQKLLQIILVGQPELREMLARSELRQLAQRITGRYHLTPLSRPETRAYVNHRLTVSGAMAPIFSGGALRTLQRVTGGIPRLINIICDRALLGAYTHELRQVDSGLVRRAAREVLGEAPSAAPWWRPRPVLALGLGVLAVIAVVLTVPFWTAGPKLEAAAVPASKSAPALTLADWLADPGHPSDTDAAFGTLFSLWGAGYAPGGSGSGCREAADAGLRCLYRRGTWNNLRGFDLPAIVTLTDGAGGAHQLVMTRIDGHGVTLRAGSTSASFPIAEVEPMWYGEFLVLWRPDSHAPHPLTPGMVGTGVAWLRTQLATLQHADDSHSAIYDTALIAAVKRFQAEQHMQVDGIAGEETLVRLSAVLAQPGTPLLSGGG